MISLRGSPLTSRVKVQPDSGSEDFGPGQKPFGQGSGFYNYTGNCTIPTLVPGGQKTGTCHQWGQINANRCPLEPRGDLLAQRNPTCDIRTYTGGLAVCLHGWHLLDADQPIPWTDRPLVYYKKYRVYFQEYEPTKHKQIQRHDWGIGSGNGAKTPELANGGAEYDVPQCAANSGGVTTTCNHTIQVSPLSCPSPCPHLRAYLADSPRLPPYFSRARRDGSTEPQAGTQAKKQWQEDQDPRTRPFVRHPRCLTKDQLAGDMDADQTRRQWIRGDQGPEGLPRCDASPLVSGAAPSHLLPKASLQKNDLLHSHAPTCLRLDVYNNDTGKLICRVEPVYGGTGGYVADRGGTFDEEGYVANPPVRGNAFAGDAFSCFVALSASLTLKHHHCSACSASIPPTGSRSRR